jgi:hypothetical protein
LDTIDTKAMGLLSTARTEALDETHPTPTESNTAVKKMSPGFFKKISKLFSVLLPRRQHFLPGRRAFLDFQDQEFAPPGGKIRTETYQQEAEESRYKNRGLFPEAHT